MRLLTIVAEEFDFTVDFVSAAELEEFIEEDIESDEKDKKNVLQSSL